MTIKNSKYFVNDDIFFQKENSEKQSLLIFLDKLILDLYVYNTNKPSDKNINKFIVNNINQFLDKQLNEYNFYISSVLKFSKNFDDAISKINNLISEIEKVNDLSELNKVFKIKNKVKDNTKSTIEFWENKSKEIVRNVLITNSRERKFLSDLENKIISLFNNVGYLSSDDKDFVDANYKAKSKLNELDRQYSLSKSFSIKVLWFLLSSIISEKSGNIKVFSSSFLDEYFWNDLILARKKWFKTNLLSIKFDLNYWKNRYKNNNISDDWEKKCLNFLKSINPNLNISKDWFFWEKQNPSFLVKSKKVEISLDFSKYLNTAFINFINENKDWDLIDLDFDAFFKETCESFKISNWWSEKEFYEIFKNILSNQKAWHNKAVLNLFNKKDS